MLRHADPSLCLLQDVLIALQHLNDEEVSSAFWAALGQTLDRSRTQCVKALLLEGFVLRTSLLSCAKEGPAAVREGCRQNKIEFDLLDHDDVDLEESDAESNKGSMKKRRKEKRRKRRRERKDLEGQIRKKRRRHTTHGLASLHKEAGDGSSESEGPVRRKGLRHSWPFQNFGDSGESADSGSVPQSWVLKHGHWSCICSSKTFSPCVWEFATQKWLQWFFKRLK